MSLTGTEQTPMTQEEYLRNPNTCPFCRSTEVTGGSVNIDGNVASQEMFCHDCDKEWSDDYTLTGYQET